MNTAYTQQIIDTIDEILTVIKQAGHRTNDLKKHQQNAERHNNLKMVKYYTHQIDICDLATIRLKQRLKRQAEEIISLISLNIIPDLNK